MVFSLNFYNLISAISVNRVQLSFPAPAKLSSLTKSSAFEHQSEASGSEPFSRNLRRTVRISTTFRHHTNWSFLLYYITFSFAGRSSFIAISPSYVPRVEAWLVSSRFIPDLETSRQIYSSCGHRCYACRQNKPLTGVVNNLPLHSRSYLHMALWIRNWICFLGFDYNSGMPFIVSTSTRPSQPRAEDASISIKASSIWNLAWCCSVLRPLPVPSIVLFCYSDLKGRGHFSGRVSTARSWFWETSYQALYRNMLQFAWTTLVNSLSNLCFLFPEPNLLNVRYIRLNGREHQSIVVSDSLDWLWGNSYQSLGQLVSWFPWSEVRRAKHLGLFYPSSLQVVQPRLSPRSIEVFTVCLTEFLWIEFSYSSFKKRLQFSSHWERSFSSSSFVKEGIFPSLCLSRGGQIFSFVVASNHSIFFIAFVASEDAFGFVLMTTVGGKGCFLTSTSFEVTRLDHWDLITKTLPTHLNYASNSLSFSHENLSFPLSFVLKFSVSFQRGCTIPSLLVVLKFKL